MTGVTASSIYTDRGYCSIFPCTPKFTFIRANASVSDPSKIYTVKVYWIQSGGTETLLVASSVGSSSTAEFQSTITFTSAHVSNIYAQNSFYFIARYYSSSQVLLGYDDIGYFNIRGTNGSSLRISEERTQADYFVVNKTEFSFKATEDYTAQYPASIARTTAALTPLVSWKVTCPDGYQRTLDGAATAGFITIVTNQTVGSVKSYSEIKIKFRVTGAYTVSWTATYITDTYYSYTSTTSGSCSLTAYNALAPQIEIVSVTPAEYKTGDENPLNGLPPYTVVFRDTSLSRLSGQIPQASTHFNFGDKDSGSANDIDVINSSPSWVTPPDQTHLFNSYGPFTITMTTTDKLGDTAYATVQFVPSPSPRVIKPPTLSPLSGMQPLLTEGHAFVAGAPLPTVIWEYELQQGTTQYYTGEKQGDSVELSLLAGGTYTVTYTVKDASETVIDTTSWTVTVTQAPTYPDNPIAADDFEVWIFDTSGNRVGILDPAERAEYIDRYNHEKYCEFRIPINSRHAQHLRRGCLFAFGYLGKARLMIVDEYTEDADGKFVTIGAVDAAGSLFQGRVAIIATNKSTEDGYDKQACSGEALMRYFANINLTDPGQTTNYRAAPGFRVVGTNQDRPAGAEKVSYSARYETTTEIMDDLCSASGLGWDSCMQDAATLLVGWKVTEGVDRTKNNTAGNRVVYFSEEEDDNCTAKVGAYQEFLGPTVAITAGEGAGSSREYLRFGSPTISGFARREIFIDASDTTDATEMEQEALAEIESEKEQNITIEPTGRLYKFGTDYQVGDFVTVKTKSGLEVDLQINQATMTKDSSGIHLQLQLGTDKRNYQSMLRKVRLANTYAKK